MTDMKKKDNDISRVASGLMAVAVVALVIIGWVAAVATSDDTGIAKLEPWWRGLSAIFFLMALLWTAHFFLPRRVPLITSVILAAASAMITGFGIAFFRPFGWGRSSLVGIGSLRLDCYLEASRTHWAYTVNYVSARWFGIRLI
ncbi:hypothetical protein [Rothia dentocariosa]|uniref:hypothetical protein n=1 Tax=Rothia dentocariosa TaxID=2047 RepID=UPI00244D7CBC|nr:hypothetical protein [Rothia dentocariosa]